MGDIANELRERRVPLKTGEYDGTDLMRAYVVMDDAANEIERLRADLADRDKAVPVGGSWFRLSPRRTCS